MQLSDSLYHRFEEVSGAYAKDIYSLRENHDDGDAIGFGEQLIRFGYLDRDTTGGILASEMGRTYVNLGKTLFQQELLNRVTGDIARKLGAIPLYRMGSKATVGMSNPVDEKAIHSLEALLGTAVSPMFCFRDEVESAIDVNYQNVAKLDTLLQGIDLTPFQQANLSEKRLRELIDGPQLVQFADQLILLALKYRASDIHIEPKRTDMVVRFRIDGEMIERMRLPIDLALPLASRYKVISMLDITDRRRPQDGRFVFPLPSKKIDIRVSTLPTICGEKLVMRVLGSLYGNSMLNIDKINLSPAVAAPLKRAVQKANGMLLVTGPTGSGKTTTLYATMNFINRPGINVVTIEDPVEYEIPSINQIQVDDKAGRSFQAVLRSVLRQDPDVVLVGETRDAETARIATQAALTGHLVLTTLHTSNALQASTRLIDMGVERYMLAPSLLGVLNQRLVRRLCEVCKTDYQPSPEYLRQFFRWNKDFNLPPLYRGEGCEHCEKTGFHGRIGIHEFLQVTPKLRDALMRGAGYDELRDIAVKEGFKEMRYDGLKKALRGLTTIDEVIKSTTTEFE